MGIFNALDTKGLAIRPKFRWKDADEIYIGAGVYHHQGTVDQIVHWDSELTFVAGSGGSNSDSVDLDASNWFYHYIDNSAIVTLGANLLTSAQFVMNKTAPTYSHAKHGWYNGLDRCIFAGLTTGGNALIEFINDNDTVWWADSVENQAAVDIDQTFTDIGALTMPGFATIGLVTFEISDETQIWYWRTNGQTGAVGHRFGNEATNANAREVITDSSQIIELKATNAGSGASDCRTHGWKFPVGM